MSTEEKIENAEKQSRTRIETALWSIQPDLQIFETPVSGRYDIWFVSGTTSGDTVVALEQKHRWCNSDTYPDNMLKKAKYEYLLTLNSEAWYSNTFKDGHCKIWDVKHTTPCRTGWAYVYKVENDPTQGKEWQEQVYFDNNDVIYYL